MFFQMYHYIIPVHGLFQKKRAPTVFKTRLSLKEKAEGLLTCHRLKNVAGVFEALSLI